MFGTNIYLTHKHAQMHVRELLAETERQRLVTVVGAQAQIRRTCIAAVQAGLATLLLRAGSWLMPPDESADIQRPVAFALRTGE